MGKAFLSAMVGALLLAPTNANAGTRTIEATVSNFAGDAELLAEMGIRFDDH